MAYAPTYKEIDVTYAMFEHEIQRFISMFRGKVSLNIGENENAFIGVDMFKCLLPLSSNEIAVASMLINKSTHEEYCELQEKVKNNKSLFDNKKLNKVIEFPYAVSPDMIQINKKYIPSEVYYGYVSDISSEIYNITHHLFTPYLHLGFESIAYSTLKQVLRVSIMEPNPPPPPPPPLPIFMGGGVRNETTYASGEPRAPVPLIPIRMFTSTPAPTPPPAPLRVVGTKEEEYCTYFTSSDMIVHTWECYIKCIFTMFSEFYKVCELEMYLPRMNRDMSTYARLGGNGCESVGIMDIKTRQKLRISNKLFYYNVFNTLAAYSKHIGNVIEQISTYLVLWKRITVFCFIYKNAVSVIAGMRTSRLQSTFQYISVLANSIPFVLEMIMRKREFLIMYSTCFSILTARIFGGAFMKEMEAYESGTEGENYMVPLISVKGMTTPLPTLFSDVCAITSMYRIFFSMPVHSYFQYAQFTSLCKNALMAQLESKDAFGAYHPIQEGVGDDSLFENMLTFRSLASTKTRYKFGFRGMKNTYNIVLIAIEEGGGGSDNTTQLYSISIIERSKKTQFLANICFILQYEDPVLHAIHPQSFRFYKYGVAPHWLFVEVGEGEMGAPSPHYLFLSFYIKRLLFMLKYTQMMLTNIPYIMPAEEAAQMTLLATFIDNKRHEKDDVLYALAHTSVQSYRYYLKRIGDIFDVELLIQE